MIKEIKQPNSWSCSACVAAMITVTTLEDVVIFLGHDGSRISEDSLHPDKHRGFYMREIMLYLACFGIGPGLSIKFNEGDGEKWTIIDDDKYDKIEAIWFPISHPAIIAVKSKNLKECEHVILWMYGRIYDSDPKTNSSEVRLKDYDIVEWIPLTFFEDEFIKAPKQFLGVQMKKDNND